MKKQNDTETNVSADPKSPTIRNSKSITNSLKNTEEIEIEGKVARRSERVEASGE